MLNMCILTTDLQEGQAMQEKLHESSILMVMPTSWLDIYLFKLPI